MSDRWKKFWRGMRRLLRDNDGGIRLRPSLPEQRRDYMEWLKRDQQERERSRREEA